NRWGEKVFETNDPAIGWDGTYEGKAATPAVYVYYLDAVCFDNQRFFKKGNISLIR
ncbi:MAG: gliding motility-associated C-terminal domain-containing protein, partial [Bacteroidota bacterium]